MERLRQRADFLAAATGAKAPASGFVLQARKRHEDGPKEGTTEGPKESPVRVGFTCSKKVGNAVERNRVRRRLKEVVRLSQAARMKPGHDYVLIGRRKALELPFDRMIEDFDRALRRIHTVGRAAPATSHS